MHCSRHWGIESCILLCLDYQYARKIRKQINFHWTNYEDNEERRKHVLQSPSLCLFTTILIHRDDDISVSKSISLQLLTCFFPINGFLSGMLSSVQSLSNVRLFATPWTAACQASVHHRLPEFTQAHVHWVGDAIQPSHPLSSPSPPALKLSQHQGLFKWVISSHQVAKVLEFQLQHQSFQWTPRTDLL